MKIHKSIIILFFALVLCLIPIKNSYSQPTNFIFFNETDTGAFDVPGGALYYFFDLRDRETFIQLTYPAVTEDFEFTGVPAVAHVQIFDVSNNCNENDFF